MLNVRVISNQKHVSKKIDQFFRQIPRATEKAVQQAGFQLIAIIKKLTKQGVDFRRRRFAPYSEQYIKRLQREGKRTNVDLIYSGEMLGSLTSKVRGKGKATVFFNRASTMKRALFNQVMNSPTREFFGFDKRTEQIIQKQFRKTVEKLMKRV